MSLPQEPYKKSITPNCRPLISGIGNPQRLDPNQLSIVLFSANIVVACLSLVRLIVTPREFYGLAVRRSGIYVLSIAHNHYLGESRCTLQLDLQGGQVRRREFISRQMRPALHICQYVVGSRVDVTLAECIKHRLACDISLDKGICITAMGRDVIGTRFKAEPVPLIQGDVDEAFGTPVSDRILFAAGARRIRSLVILAKALEDFDHGLRVRIVVPPIGSHGGSGAVRSGYTVELLEVCVQGQGVRRRAANVFIGKWITRQGPNPPLCEQHIAMSLGI